MNRVCIITTKIPKITSVNLCNLIEYQNQLTNSAKTFPGYVDSMSYWKQNNNISYNKQISYKKICNISEWESLDDWNYWLSSESRNHLQKKYNESVKSENVEILYQRHNFCDIPLL